MRPGRMSFSMKLRRALIIFATLLATILRGRSVSGVDVTVDASGEAVTDLEPSTVKQLLRTISDKALIKEIKRRGYKVKRRKKKTLSSRGLKHEPEILAKAQELNQNAINEAQNGDLWGSLQKFKQLIDMVPDNSEYWNNLGVTQMRVSTYHAAEASYRKAIEFDSTYMDAHDNLNVLKSYLPHTKPHREPRPKKHTTRKAKRIHIKDLFSNYKYKEYAGGKKPFILTGAMDGFTALQKWNLRYLHNLFPEAIMDYYPQNMYRESVKPRFVPIAFAFEDMLLSSSNMSMMYKDKPGVYIQWNLDYESWHKLMSDFNGGLPKIFREDDDWMNDCFKSDQTRSEWQRGTHWRMLLIGSKGSGMFGHKDILRTSSWQAQITGYKRWHLCSPSQDKYMCVSNILFLYYYASTNDFILYNIAITAGTKQGM